MNVFRVLKSTGTSCMLKRLLVHIAGMRHDTHVYPDLLFIKKEQLTLMVFQNQDTTSWYCARVYF